MVVDHILSLIYQHFITEYLSQPWIHLALNMVSISNVFWYINYNALFTLLFLFWHTYFVYSVFFYMLNKKIYIWGFQFLNLLCIFIFFIFHVQILRCLGKVVFSEVIIFISVGISSRTDGSTCFICSNYIARWNIWHSVSYCIHSTLLGGELSGFCFVLHSLKGTAACRRVDGKSKVEHLTIHSISSLAIHCVFFFIT